MRWPTASEVAVAVALFILLAVFTWAIKEGFATLSDTRDIDSATSGLGGAAEECGLRDSCSSCLQPKRIIAGVTTQAECEKRGGTLRQVKKDEPIGPDGTQLAAFAYSVCEKLGKCGWCAGANKCVPRTDSGFPVVPMVNDSNGKSTGVPQFACPVEAATGGRNFLITKEDCPDFQCSTIRNCRDCAQAQRCGWALDTTAAGAQDYKCMDRAAVGGIAPPESASAAVKTMADQMADDGVTTIRDAAGAAVKYYPKFITASAKCPTRACDQITDCVECATTPNCGYCEVKKKCLRLSRPAGDATPLEKCEKVETVSGKEVKTAQQPIISRSQCPAERADTTLTQRSEQSDYKATAGELASIQDDLLDGNEAAPPGVVQSVPATGGAVSEPQKKDSVGAPGVSRLLGSGGYRSGSWPAAAGLDGQGGPFESYVQMLVKSELAGQGIVTSEPFSVKDVIRNAGKVLQGM
jgi:hypothetical protein